MTEFKTQRFLPEFKGTAAEYGKARLNRYQSMREQLLCLQDKYPLVGESRYLEANRTKNVVKYLDSIYPLSVQFTAIYALDFLARRLDYKEISITQRVAVRCLIEQQTYNLVPVPADHLIAAFEGLDFTLLFPTPFHFLTDAVYAHGVDVDLDKLRLAHNLLRVAVLSKTLVQTWLASELADAVYRMAQFSPARCGSERVEQCAKALSAECPAYGLDFRIRSGSECKSEASPISDCSPSRRVRARKFQEFKTLKLLGRGAAGRVYLARDLETGTRVALKETVAGRNDDSEDEGSGNEDENAPARRLDLTFVNEIAFLKDVPSAHSLKLLDVGVVVDDEKKSAGLIEVVELLDLDLEKFLETQVTDWTESERVALIQRAARQLFAGLRDLHAYNVAHRDIKPANILTKKSGESKESIREFKIADFGLANWLCEPGLELNAVIGTWDFRAPELVVPVALRAKAVFSTAVDCWALGLTLFEIWTSPEPILLEEVYSANTDSKLVKNFIRTFGAEEMLKLVELSGYGNNKTVQTWFREAALEPPLPKFGLGNLQIWARRYEVPEVVDFFVRLIELNPLKRMTAAEALAHPFLTRTLPES